MYKIGLTFFRYFFILPILVLSPCVLAQDFTRSPGDSAPTAYAPVEVLVTQMKDVTDRIGTLIQEDNWTQNGPEIVRLANVTAVFSQVLGLHDQYSEYKMGTTVIIEASNRLAKATDNATAQTAWVELLTALKSEESKNPSWDVAVGKLPELMNSVAIYNGEIQGKMKRLRGLDSVAGRAVALSALFQGMTANYAETIHPEEVGKWQELCMQSRDVAYYLFITLEVADRKNSPKNFEKLQKTCTACHEEFRRDGE